MIINLGKVMFQKIEALIFFSTKKDFFFMFWLNINNDYDKKLRVVLILYYLNFLKH